MQPAGRKKEKQRKDKIDVVWWKKKAETYFFF
jgi:hypothetical protein